MALTFGFGAAFLGRAQYDPLVALTTVSVIGLAWYTYFTRQAIVEPLAREEERVGERRAALATAVLSELSTLMARLRRLGVDGPTGGAVEFISFSALDHACGMPELFAPGTVQSLMETRRRLQDVQFYLEAVETERGRAVHVNDSMRSVVLNMNTNQKRKLVKEVAAFAFNKAVDLVPRMSEAGGLMPSMDGAEGQDTHVTLADDPFDRKPISLPPA